MKTKVNILSPGRFHVCDLARELARNGFDVKFYSFVPTKRAMKFGLPKECSASLFWPMAPFLFLSKKLFPRREWAKKLTILFQDRLTSIVMRKCDICIAMSGTFVAAPRKAKRQGSLVIIERGSKHIMEQKRILDSIPSNKGKITVPYWHIPREIEDYDLADYVAVASRHVVRSMLKYGYPESKLFVNPYGVDLSMFHPTDNKEKEFDFIMVGNWCYQKGCDIIVDAIKQTNYHFLHVGAIGDLTFPKEDKRFTHVDPVDQTTLENYYSKAKVFIFPSRQDGFGMVLSQAVACNLPIVGSKDCGAPDLKSLVELPEYILLLDDYRPETLVSAMGKSLETYNKLDDNVYAGDAINQLTWKAYGERYSKFLTKVMGGVIRITNLYRKFDVIMVGGWSYRKGCDLIIDAIKQTNYRFLHVGSIVDLNFPKDVDRFTHVDAVDQSQLINYYNKAKVFVLPSREEGLAMVQAQAIACNLPLVGSPDSGAEDLKSIVSMPECIHIVDEYTSEAVRCAIEEALKTYSNLKGKRYAGNAIQNLTWKAYGKRYSEFINKIIQK